MEKDLNQDSNESMTNGIILQSHVLGYKRHSPQPLYFLLLQNPSPFPPKIFAFSPQLSPIWPLHTFWSLPYQQLRYLLLGLFLMT